MFSQNELEKYQQLKAPDDLKNQAVSLSKYLGI